MTHISDILSRLNIPTTDDETVNNEIFRRALILMDMGVPERFFGSAFDRYDVNFNNDAVLVKQIEELADAGKWILLRSSVSGRGKTMLAVSAMGRSQYKSGLKVSQFIFVDVQNKMEELRMAGIDREKTISKWFVHHCLLLDELGRENVNMIETVERIIKHYFNQMKQLIMTTPLTKAQWDSRYGYDITRRIEDAGAIIDLAGKRFK